MAVQSPYLPNTDALVYSQLTNNYIDGASLDYYDNRMQPRGMTPIQQGTQQATSFLNNTISNTSIKRACCLKNPDPSTPGNYLVQVRIPLPKGFVNNNNTASGQLQNKYKYIDKIVSVPSRLCSNLNDTACDNFYTVYCKNVVEGYKKLTSGAEFDYAEFSNFKPECSCYAPTPKVITDSGASNAAPKCYMPGCVRNSGVWLDPVSRGTGSDCVLTICNANIDISQLQAGRNISIANTIQQNCGAKSTQYTPTKPTPTGTSPTPTTQPSPTQPASPTQPTSPTTQPTSPTSSDMMMIGSRQVKKLYVWLSSGLSILLFLIILFFVLL